MYNKTKLSSGLRLVSYNIPTAKSFSLGVFVNSGSRDDFEECHGVAHFIEHCVFRRIKNKTSKAISREFDKLGAYNNAFTTKEIICFYLRALPDNLVKLLKLMYEITINPVFDDRDINKERKIITEEIKSYYDDPEELILDYADEVIFSDSTMAHPIIGTEETIKNINADTLNRFHDIHFSPENMVIAIVGNFEHKYLVDTIEKIFTWKGHTPSNGLLQTAKQRALHTYKPATKTFEMDYAQNHFLYCTRACNYSSEEKFALAALNFLLGEGNSSRLNMTLREKFGLVYTVYSNIQLLSDTGVFSIYAGSENKNIGKIQSIIETEIAKLMKTKISEKELKLAKQQLKSSAVMSIESYSDLMQDIAKCELMNQSYHTTEDIIKKIDDIHLDTINEAVEKYMNIDIWSKIIFNIN